MKSSGARCSLPPPAPGGSQAGLVRMLADPGGNIDAALTTEGYCFNVVYYAHRLLPAADAAVLHWYDPQIDRLIPYSIFGNANQDVPSLGMRAGSGNAGLVFVEKKARMISNTAECIHFVPRRGAPYEVRALISAPLMHDNVCCGVLSVHSTHENGFSTQDMDWLERYALLAATFHDIVGAYRQEIDNRAWSHALVEATAAMADSLDPAHVLDSVLEQVGRVLPARGQDILLIEGDEVVLTRQHGYDFPDLSKRICLPVTLSSFRFMLETGLPFLSNDVTRIPDWVIIEELPWIRSYAGVPLRAGGKIIGFLNVTSDMPNRFTQEMLERLKTFGDHASIALENARLHDDLKSALRQEQIMRDKMIQSENLASMGKMVSLISHAINNPLQAIMNSLYLVEQDIPADSPLHEVIAIANADINRLTRLVVQLRQAYRTERDEQQTLSLASVLENVNALILPQLPDRGIVWHCRMIPATYKVKGIAGKLMKAFLNIVLNAVEAMDGAHGGDLVLDWQLKAQGRYIGVTVRDSGPGIQPEDLERVFNPYFSTKETKIGLGLVISKQIIRQHDGWIEVHSLPERGTTFTVWLPLAEG